MTIEPGLVAFVEAAKDQRAEPTLTADELFDAWDRRRRRRTLVLVTSGVAAAAAAVALWLGGAPASSPEPSTQLASATHIEPAPAPAPEAGAAEATEHAPLQVAGEAVAFGATNFSRSFAPAENLRVVFERLPTTTWEVAAAGTFDQVEPAVEVERTQLKVAPGARAAALARRADAAMAEGHQSEAIELLDQLVTRYPRSSPARSAMLDLGRLYQASGRRDEARCTYVAFLERWPHHSLRAEIESRVERLGGPEGCG